MGANFFVACHRCKEKAFALRDFKSTGETLTRFFHKHYECGKQDSKNVEVAWDYFGELDWMNNDEIYTDVTEEVCETYKNLEHKIK